MEQSIAYRLPGGRSTRAAYEAIQQEPASSLHVVHFSGQGFPFHLHYHPELEMTLIVRGRGLRFVADSIEDFDEGDLCLIGQRVLHTWQSSSRSRVSEAIVVQFSREVMRPLEQQWPEMRPITRLLDLAARGLQFRGGGGSSGEGLSRTMHALAATAPGSMERMSLFLQLLSAAAACGQPTPLSSTPSADAQDDQTAARLNRVLQHVHAHLTDPLTLGGAAALAEMSPASFCRFFRKMVGKTFVGYVNQWRIRVACRELIGTRRPVTQIAFDCGFENLSNFNRRFRQFKQMTPSEFRRRLAQ